jgi:small subunit ribosomal protein S24e
MTYLLFGAYKAQVTPSGIDCDDWLPITGNLDALDDIERLKTMMEGCMLRVFEGITMGNRSSRHARDRIPILRREEESESGDEDDENDMRDYSLSPKEVKELDLLTRDTVRVLNKYAEERMASQSRANSRPATPFDSPSWSSGRLPPSGVRSGYATPQGTITPFGSRPGTPSRLARS